jgi:hypothetical protein
VDAIVCRKGRAANADRSGDRIQSIRFLAALADQTRDRTDASLEKAVEERVFLRLFADEIDLVYGDDAVRLERQPSAIDEFDLGVAVMFRIQRIAIVDLRSLRQDANRAVGLLDRQGT